MEGIERIKSLASEITCKATLKVIEYLISREDMSDKYLNEEKSLKQMIEFIRSNAKKNSKNGWAFVENEEVYGWAIHYFDESNEKLGLSNTFKNNKVVEHIQEKDSDEDEEEQETTKVIKPIKKPKYVAEGQISLFDM